MDDGMKALKKVYIKVFSKNNSGRVRFYKDGYTDLRGMFNYVSLNTDELATIQKFSIFVTDDIHGSLMKECNPPPNISGSGASSGSNYEQYQNMRQQVKEKWRSVNKSKKK